MQLKPFTPQSENYLIYYPETNVVEEAEDGTVTISSIELDINFIIHNYSSDQSVSEKSLLDYYTKAFASYTPVSDLNRFEVNDQMILERTFIKDDTHWLCWALSYKNQIIIASVHSEFELDDETYDLYRHLVETIVVLPFEGR